MSQGKEYLTKEKFDELKKELDYLKTDKRKEVAESLEYAKGLGDLSENAEYHEAREMQATVEDRIAKLDEILQSASIVSDTHGDKINIGSAVTLEKDKDKSKHKFVLVSSEEVDVSVGRISIHSPLGSALVGKKKFDHITFDAPSGPIGYSIIEVK